MNNKEFQDFANIIFNGYEEDSIHGDSLFRLYGEFTKKLLEKKIPKENVIYSDANVILNEAFGKPTIAVDTHVFRVSNRTGLVVEKNVLNTEKELLRVTPKKWIPNAHHYLILHGRYVCKARKFDCKQCAINKECEYPEKN